MPAVDELKLRAERHDRMERRRVHAPEGHPIELRADDAGGVLHFTGYAATFDTEYEVFDMFGSYQESVAPGAFTKTIQERDDVRFLIEHEGLALARTKNSSLTLEQTEVGLLANADLQARDPDVQRIEPKLARGDVDQMSFMFETIRQEWDEDYTHRRLLEVKLWDVSVVTFPASPTTSALPLREADLIYALADADADQLLLLAARSDGGAGLRAAAERAHDVLQRLLDPQSPPPPAGDAGGIGADPPAMRDQPSTMTIEQARRNLELLKLQAR